MSVDLDNGLFLLDLIPSSWLAELVAYHFVTDG